MACAGLVTVVARAVANLDEGPIRVRTAAICALYFPCICNAVQRFRSDQHCKR